MLHITRRFAPFVLAMTLAACGDDGEGDLTTDDLVHLNQVQVLGSHNSYHIQPKEPLFSILTQLDRQFLAWEYTHLPLDQQFEAQGIRQIEIDVFADPQGGLYEERKILTLIEQDPHTGIAELLQPGFKVHHIQELDFESTCLTFIGCLRTVKAWSDAHPSHLPIAILVELKDDPIPDPIRLSFVIPIRIGTPELDALDAEIRSVFPEDQLITPDDIRQGRTTLEEAVLELGWPTLRDARGKVIFLMDNDNKRDAYIAGHPSLAGRVVFTNASPGDPDAAFIKVNDPLETPGLIGDLVRAGYLVRTRADGDTNEARSGDTRQRDAAIASGAHFVSSDYPVENPKFGTGYFVEIPGEGIARCNPVNGPPECDGPSLE